MKRKLELLNAEEAQQIRGGANCGSIDVIGCDTQVMFKTSDCVTFYVKECAIGIETNCSAERPFNACIPGAYKSSNAAALTAE